MFDVVSGNELHMTRYDFGQHITPEQFTLADVSADERSLSELGSAINDLHRPPAAPPARWRPAGGTSCRGRSRRC